MGIMKRKLDEKMEEQREFFRPAEFKDHPPEFEMFWRAYPKRKGKRVGKGAALRLYLKLKPAEQCEALEAAKNYARSDVAQDGYARDANRFLSTDYWRDWVDGAGDTNERERLISRLKGHAGRRYRGSTIVSTGLEGMHAERPWSDFSLKELVDMAGRLG